MMTTTYVSPTATASCVVDDYIGMESCYDLYNNEGVDGGVVVSDDRRVKKNREHPCSMMMKNSELPPPLPSPTRTENRSSRTPWVMKRYYTEDGRLVLQEEKVEHREYFKARRSNGRLTLHLIPLDDDGIDANDDNEIDYEEANGEDDHAETLLGEDLMGKCSIGESHTIESA